MDLFRSKKRGTDSTSLGDIPLALQKKRRGLSGSVDDILTAVKDDCETGTTSDRTVSDDSEQEDVVTRASKKQKLFAKKSTKLDKKREKEHKKKLEKNLISMEDFLSKQSEFKMWLYEEKYKNAGDLPSPKLKAHFKLFVRLWNKRKLSSKYYRGSDLPSSPAVTPRQGHFLTGTSREAEPAIEAEKTETDAKDTPRSPFVTFGKTPPKVFKSRKLQLFGSTPDVALISIAPIGSPKPAVPPKPSIKNIKNALTAVEVSAYQVPQSPVKERTEPSKTVEKTADDAQDSKVVAVGRGITPYKVSVFPWAVGDEDGADLDLCSTATPPNRSFNALEQEPESSWPPPPTEAELASVSEVTVPTVTQLGQRVTRSPRVPPPPPPRANKRVVRDNEYHPLPQKTTLAATYSDPYDGLPETQTKAASQSSEYQEPVDSVQTVNSRTRPDDVTAVMEALTSAEDTVSVVYAKPVKSKIQKFETDFSELYAKPQKRKTASKERMVSNEEKKPLGEASVKEIATARNVLLEEYDMSDPGYDTVGHHLTKPLQTVIETVKQESVSDCEEMKLQSGESPKFKRKRIMAASTDKIYETYLSMGRNLKPFKQKAEKSFDTNVYANVLKKKYKSQPDISLSEADSGGNAQLFDDIDISDDVAAGKKMPYLSSFGKPLDASMSEQDLTDPKGGDLFQSIASESQSIRQFLEGKKSGTAQNVKLSVAQTEIPGSVCPGTPTILSTPSFDSLCAVTPLSLRAGSSQSLPVQSGSNDILSTSQSSMALSPSTGKSSSCESLSVSEHSAHRASKESAKETIESKPSDIATEQDIVEDKAQQSTPHHGTCGSSSLQAASNGLVPMTPGKMRAAEHGIDLSVYLLKQPTHQTPGTGTPGTGHRGEETLTPSAGQEDIPVFNTDTNPAVNSRPTLDMQAYQIKGRPQENQSRLAIRETLSGVKTKVDPTKSTGKKEQPRRHTVQTVHEIKTAEKKLSTPVAVPMIGIASKARKLDASANKTSPLKNKLPAQQLGCEPDRKRVCTEADNVKGPKLDPYLETDIDSVDIASRGIKREMKKSKSHSGFQQGTSTVVTEIW